MEDVPYFNAPIYFANKQQIGKIDEIFGTYSDYFVSIKLNSEIKAKSFKGNDKVIIIFQFVIECIIHFKIIKIVSCFSYTLIQQNCYH